MVRNNKFKSSSRFCQYNRLPTTYKAFLCAFWWSNECYSRQITIKKYLNEATVLSPDHPVVISQFITHAKELEIDGVAKDGELVIYAISEHIENAGIHSGDATVVYPAQTLYLETVRRAHYCKESG